MSNSVASSYLFGDAAAARFFPRSFRDPSDRRQAVSEAAKRRCSPQLLAVLRRQNERFGANALRHQRIEALERGSCAVVFTGQQVGLFGGPLYSFHKALSAIAVARQLEAESGTAVIPIFWLQTEDHDFAEIACCYAPGPDRSVTRFAVDESDPAGSERRSVASRVLGAGVDAALAALDACCEGLADWSATGEILRRHYCPEARWADAFAGLFAELFADDGLLLFDPRVPEVAALASDVHRRAIDERAAIEATLAARAEQLAAAGFDVQIPIRPGCAL